LYTVHIHNGMVDKMQDNQREEISYLAGLFDGEGTICIQKDSRPLAENNGRNWNPIYNVTFRVGMIEQKAIESFKEFFGVGFIDCEKTYHKFRPMWRYSIRAKNDAKMVIEKIKPFLRVKRPQADLAMRFFEETPSQRGMYLTPEILEKKEYFFLEMKKLNGIDISLATTKRRGRPLSVRVCDSLNTGNKK
jgi:hypothetical protein